MSTYKKLPVTGGGGGTTDDVTNASGVSGSTASDALDQLDTDIDNVEFITIATQYKPEPIIELQVADIANKYIVLTDAPTVPNKTQMYIIGGSAALYGTDFIVTADNSGKRLSWDGLALESEFASGDKILVIYN